MEQQQRIASSAIIDVLFGDTTKVRLILAQRASSLIDAYGGGTPLAEYFAEIPNRIICVCPMVLCDAMLADLFVSAPDDLLGGLGLAMYSISTHDDVVDERPESRGSVASLIYSGNIASLEGIALLFAHGHGRVAQKVVGLMNLNHRFQVDIISSLWSGPTDEAGYLAAISHTGYWAAVGTVAAAAYIDRLDDLEDFAVRFGQNYGRMCQIYDDIREIDDDRRNGYFSLAISAALANTYNLDDTRDRLRVIERPKAIAAEAFQELRILCGDRFSRLLRLSQRMHEVGQRL